MDAFVLLEDLLKKGGFINKKNPLVILAITFLCALDLSMHPFALVLINS